MIVTPAHINTTALYGARQVRILKVDHLLNRCQVASEDNAAEGPYWVEAMHLIGPLPDCGPLPDRLPSPAEEQARALTRLRHAAIRLAERLGALAEIVQVQQLALEDAADNCRESVFPTHAERASIYQVVMGHPGVPPEEWLATYSATEHPFCPRCRKRGYPTAVNTQATTLKPWHPNAEEEGVETVYECSCGKAWKVPKIP